MPEYRIYPLDDEGHIKGPAVPIECETDEQAIEHARQYVDSGDIELWEEPRLVRQFKSASHRGGNRHCGTVLDRRLRSRAPPPRRGSDVQRRQDVRDLGPDAWLPAVAGRFMSIGGEWFGMWQLQHWNGVASAFRFVVVILGVLIFVAMRDAEIEAT